MLRQWIVFFLAFTVAACASFIVDVGNWVELPIGKKARLAGTDVSAQFSRVVRDSRCPACPGCACGIRGFIEIELTIEHKDGRAQTLLMSDTMFDDEGELKGLESFDLLFYLRGVEPWPNGARKYLEYDYVATIKVAHAR